MAKKKIQNKTPRQSWRPHPVLEKLYRVWMVIFGIAKVALGALATVVIILGVCALVFAGAVAGYLEEDVLNQQNSDGSYELDLNSYVYYVDGNGEIQLLQNVFAEDNRDWVDFEEIPEDLIHATVAIEDKRFFEHQGVDWITTMKACFFMFFGNGDRGGSTITQQLVKNVTDNKSVTVQRKVQEIFTAIEYEKRYDKNEILEWYLNEIYMGNRAYGVKRAAATYFGKELEMLTIAECASLISITNNPSLYNPYRENLDAGGLTGRERNRVRQMDTLEEMHSQGWITQEQYDEAVAQEMVFKRGIADEDKMAQCVNDSCAYRGTVGTLIKREKDSNLYCPKCEAVVPVGEDASQEVYSYFVDTVLEDVAQALAERDGLEWNNETKKSYKSMISRSGYHIYTTLDMDVQNDLDSIYTDLSEIPKARNSQQLQSAMVIIDNKTGDIVAMSGGVGVKNVHDGLNRATDSDLQTGSSIKPLSIYAPAFESGGVSPATVIRDLPYNYVSGAAWPKNSDKKYDYSLTIHDAIVSSVNAVAVNTLEKIGLGYAYKFAKEQFGLSGLTDTYTTYTGEVKSDAGYAPLALGAQTVGITVRDMASAFASFANNGVYREGRTFTKVYDNNGNLVLDNTQDSRQVLSAKTVNYVHYCLGDAVTEGTGKTAQVSGQTVYGKTGTTSSNKDRWFCGYTGHYTAAVWSGFDTPEVINASGNASAQLFKKVMTKVHKGLDRVNLLDTKDFTDVTVCLDSGKLATDLCKADVRGGAISRVDTVKVHKSDVPKNSCDAHVTIDYCTAGGGAANQYCKLFAQHNQTAIEKKVLVKLAQTEMEAIKKASGQGLNGAYVDDSYVYLVDKAGKDVNFKGFNGDKNAGISAPYICCTAHTEQNWKSFEASQQAPVPTVPADPGTNTQPQTGNDAAG